MTNNNISRLLKKLNEALIDNGGADCELVPNIFFPEDIHDYRQKQLAVKDAKEICAECPVFTQCFAYAVVAQEEYGLWAGLTVEERKDFKRKRKLFPANPNSLDRQ